MYRFYHNVKHHQKCWVSFLRNVTLSLESVTFLSKEILRVFPLQEILEAKNNPCWKLTEDFSSISLVFPHWERLHFWWWNGNILYFERHCSNVILRPLKINCAGIFWKATSERGKKTTSDGKKCIAFSDIVLKRAAVGERHHPVWHLKYIMTFWSG